MKLVLDYDEDLSHLFIENADTDRSTVSTEFDDNRTRILISAKDPVAMRASVNGVLKTIIVYEKTKKALK